jgi:hypothetical protein
MEEVERKIGSDENIYFNPSRTAQNGINFVTKDLIEELKNCENERIKDLFRLLCILVGEEFNKSQPIRSFFNSIATKNFSMSNFNII